MSFKEALQELERCIEENEPFDIRQFDVQTGPVYLLPRVLGCRVSDMEYLLFLELARRQDLSPSKILQKFVKEYIKNNKKVTDFFAIEPTDEQYLKLFKEDEWILRQ